MAMTPDEELLPCGVALEPLIIQVTDGEPPADLIHQNGCPYCQGALRSLRQGWDDVQALTHEPVPIPAGLTTQIMARVRALAPHLTGSILLGHSLGETRVSLTVVGQSTQRVAAAVPGVVFASAKPIPHDPPEPGRLSVAIRLVVAFGPAIDTLTRAVREVVDRHIPTLTGAELSRIDISIEDLAELPDESRNPFGNGQRPKRR